MGVSFSFQLILLQKKEFLPVKLFEAHIVREALFIFPRKRMLGNPPDELISQSIALKEKVSILIPSNRLALYRKSVQPLRRIQSIIRRTVTVLYRVLFLTFSIRLANNYSTTFFF